MSTERNLVLVFSLCVLFLLFTLFPFRLSPSSSLPKAMGMVGMSVVWMSGRGVASSPEVIGSVPPQTVYVGDSLSIPLDLSHLFTDFFSLQLDCPFASCELQGGSHSMTLMSTGPARMVLVEGDYAYIPTWGDGFQLWNICDPLSPSVISNTNVGSSSEVEVVGDYAYFATWDGLVIVNISDPLSPFIVSSLATGNSIGIAMQGEFAFVATYDGLVVVNISDPFSPSLVITVDTGLASTVIVEGEYAYVPAPAGLRIVSISNPLSSDMVSTANIIDSSGVAIVEDRAYVTSWTEGFAIVNISDPINPSILSSSFLSDQSLEAVAVVGDYAYLAVNSNNNGLIVVNVSDPFSPVVVAMVNVGISYGVLPKGQTLYMATTSGIQILSNQNVLLATPNVSNRFNYTIQLRGCNLSGDCSDPLEIQINVPNRQPTSFFDGESLMSFHVADPFPYSTHFIDLDGDPLELSLSLLPAGWTFSSNMTQDNQRTDVFIEGSLQSGAQGDWTISVNASDGHGGTTSLSFQVNVANRPPQLNPNATLSFSFTVAYQVPFQYSFDEDVFVDEDGDPLEYSAMLSDGSSLPSTLQFESDTRTLQGTLSQSVVIRFTATDPFDGLAFFEVDFIPVEESKELSEASANSALLLLFLLVSVLMNFQ